jgi:hypothetical protein
MTNLLKRRRFAFTAALAVAALAAGCSSPSAAAPQAAAEYATERMSNAGLYRVTYRPETTPVPVQRLQAWTLHIARPDGTPVADAQIAVDGDMPEHRHGLPTRPRMTRYLGNGDYLVEGIKFQMGGWWVMDFAISSEGRTDSVRFNLQLKK